MDRFGYRYRHEPGVFGSYFRSLHPGKTGCPQCISGDGPRYGHREETHRCDGGTISITSEEGKGSTFVITIPYEIAPAEEEKPKEKGHVDIAGLHLMLVEDNELNAEIAQMLLTDKGARVTVVGDGKQAVDLFKNKIPGTFDAILMDIMMPVMDGMTATRVIRSFARADAKTIPIIAMTANAFDEDAKKCIEAGMNAHLTKPIEIDRVIEALGQYCR